MAEQATWIFDEVPPSGTRRGGNPSEHAFEHDLDTFVREVLQNSNDVIVDAPVEVDFKFLELEGEKLAEFLDILGWDELHRHLDAAAATESGGNLEQQLEGLTERDRLRLLIIEDRNTEGLTGAEAGESSNFTALCKDTLYSHKGENTSAGGTHGLGKSVHWSFSGLSTVVFNSILYEDEEHESPRLIGRAELPSHELDDGWYTGSGWFGRPTALESGDHRAESVWNGKASELATKLQLTRDGNGTSVMIAGFRDPTRSEERSMKGSAEAIRAASAKYFWPALMSNNPRLSVSAGIANDEQPLVLSEYEELSNFVDCYHASLENEAGDTLEKPGDIVTREIDVEIPPKQDEQEGTTATATLAVRLAQEDSGNLLNCVAPFRRAGMVIDYWDRSRVAVNARPFHAALICGEARNLSNSTKADSALEEFLRLAEPPAHDDWQSTEKLRETYKQGYAKAIKQLKTAVRDELAELTTPETSGSERGPDRTGSVVDFPSVLGGMEVSPAAPDEEGLHCISVTWVANSTWTRGSSTGR